MVRNRRISMKNAKELILEYTVFSFRDPKKAAEMHARTNRCGGIGNDEVFCAADKHIPWPHRGRGSIRGCVG
jgi:hypothetical protein